MKKSVLTGVVSFALALASHSNVFADDSEHAGCRLECPDSRCAKAQEQLQKFAGSGDVADLMMGMKLIRQSSVTNANSRLLKKKAELHLYAYQLLRDSQDTDFDVKDVPFGSITPPGGKYRSGIAPEAIKETEIREAYEKAIADNEAKAKAYRSQYRLHRMERRVLEEAAASLCKAYGGSTGEVAELHLLLDRYKADAPLRDAVLKDSQTAGPSDH